MKVIQVQNNDRAVSPISDEPASGLYYLSLIFWIYIVFCKQYTGFAKYLKLEGFLDKSLKIKSVWKVLKNHSKASKSP